MIHFIDRRLRISYTRTSSPKTINISVICWQKHLTTSTIMKNAFCLIFPTALQLSIWIDLHMKKIRRRLKNLMFHSLSFLSLRSKIFNPNSGRNYLDLRKLAILISRRFVSLLKIKNLCVNITRNVWKWD